MSSRDRPPLGVPEQERGGDTKAVRAAVRREGHDVSFRDAIARRARRLGVTGWVRSESDGTLLLHAEGERQAVDELEAFIRDKSRDRRESAVEINETKVEGHEQFAIRGVSAGIFVVQEHAATAHHFDLRLEVGGVMRSWAIPKGPSLDPSVKRLAVEVGEHSKEHNSFEGGTDGGGVIVWDRGTYEQGGRVPWPEALRRGHAVFVLHGEKLHGGFVLQRSFPDEKAQWLLIKRQDEEARPGSDIEVERPESVVSGRTLDEILER